MQITMHPQLNIVIGNPLTHSQSPLLHNIIYKMLNMDSIMLARPHTDLKSLVQAIKTFSIELTAVTMPFKEKIIQYLDDACPDVTQLKAANTVIQRNGRLHGYNTDIAGITFAFSGIELYGKQALVMGAGGAARTMGYFLKMYNSKILWMNRNAKKAAILAKEFGGDIITDDQLKAISPDIIINATPVGLYPHVNESLLTQDIFNEKQIVFDMVYNPIFTTLLKQAQKKHAKIISGLDMFIGQAFKQIEILTNKQLVDLELITQVKKLLIQNQALVT